MGKAIIPKTKPTMKKSRLAETERRNRQLGKEDLVNGRENP
jgi:hypothetical protein